MTARLSPFPAALALHLLEDAATAPELRDQLAALAADLSPVMADAAAADYAVTALALIRDGHPDPARLSRHVLDVVSVLGGRWDR